MCGAFLHILTAFCVFAGLHVQHVDSSDGPIVTISDGQVLGYYDNTVYGNEFVAFEGIPYAAPPIGELRFQEPQQPKRWMGVLKAHQTYKCIQSVPKYFDKGGLISGEEDCLYINVYTPQLNSSLNLDVIVHIHGGGFAYNTAHEFGPLILMETEQVVFVNFNYRLGPLGFLSTEDEIVPGNNGMKDQVLALEWIRDNIEHFGGNPNSVTITGISAGSACVHLHYLSPLSRGLFHRGIAISGTALSSWTIAENSFEKARRLSVELDCETDITVDMVNCLKKKEPDEIIRASESLVNTVFMPIFGPVVETTVGKERAFLTSTPYQLMYSGKIYNVPIIMSITQAEGLIPGASFIADDKYLHEMENRWYELAPILLDYEYTVSPEDRDKVSKQIKRYYFKGKKISVDTFEEFIKMLGDRLFVYDIEKTAKLQARMNTAPVYFYYLGYRGVYSKSEVLSGKRDNFGVSHADDGIYILSHDWATPEDSDDDKRMKEIFKNMWTSLAHNGVPTIDSVVWNPLSRALDSIHYLHIAAPGKISMQTRESFVDRLFWDKLPFDENKLSATTNEEREEL